MKRIISILILSIFTSLVFASEIYLGPFNSITNINLNSPAWGDEKTQADYDSIGSGDDLFADNQYVVTGALYNVSEGISGENKEKNFGIEVSVNSDSWDGEYFWFTSQSNPDSKRPFILQVTLQTRDVYLGWAGTTNISYNRQVFTLKGNLEPQSYYFSNRGTSYYTYYRILLFDIAIVLPGEIKNGVLTLDDGRTYSIASADDYSADLSITLRLVKRNGASNPSGWSGPEELSYSCPISGFYDPTVAADSHETVTDTSSSLNISASPKAANVDLLRDQGESNSFEIANFSYAIYNVNNNKLLSGDQQLDDNDIFLFLSASSNPYAQNKRGFEFVHTNVTSEEQKNNQNTIGYTITVQSDDAAHPTVVFDGTEFLEGDGSNNPKDRIGTTCHTENLQHSSNPDRHWHSVDGTMYLTLDAVPYTLDEGYYRSYVYVHAIVNGDKVGGQ